MTGPRTLTNRLSFFLLCTLVFTIPFDEVFALPGFGTVTRLLGYATLLAAVSDVVARGRCRALRGPAVWASVFVGWAILSLTWTAQVDETLGMLPTVIRCLGLFWLLYEYADEEERGALLLQAYVLGCYVCLLGVVRSFRQGLTIDDNEYARYAVSQLDPNDLAVILALGVPMAWHLVSSKKSRVPAWVNHLYVPLAICGVALTGSRGGLLALITAILIIPWSFRRLGLWTKLGVAVSAALVLLGMTYFVPEDALARFATIPKELAQGTLTHRTTLWRVGFELLRDHPLVGLGAGAFAQEVYAQGAFMKPQVAHNVFLGILFDLGVVGCALFASLVVSLFRGLKLLGTPERRLCTFLLATWVIAGASLSHEYRKTTWLVLGFVAAMTPRAPFGAYRRREETVPD